MQAKIVGTLALSLAALTGSMVAYAASETLTYTSAPFTSVYNASSSSPADVAVGSVFTATVTLNAPLTKNLATGGASGNESGDVTSLVFTTVDGSKTNTITVTPGQGSGSSFDFTTNSLGQITGWDFTAGIVANSTTGQQLPASLDELFHSCFNDGCTSGNYNGQGYSTTGDWYDYMPSSSTASDGCTYTNTKSCGNSSGAVGKWTVAPELSASNAGTGLTLLFGGLAVLFGRRRGAMAPAA
jgi:hypothetical protein